MLYGPVELFIVIIYILVREYSVKKKYFIICYPQAQCKRLVYKD